MFPFYLTPISERLLLLPHADVFIHPSQHPLPLVIVVKNETGLGLLSTMVSESLCISCAMADDY